MDGIHDMGGMQGFGAVEHDPDEPVFYTDWEARMRGISASLTGPPDSTLDWGRFLIECIPPADYLSIEYYNKWYLEAAVNYISSGLVTIDELVSGKAKSIPEGMGEPMPPEMVRKEFGRREITAMPAVHPEQFQIKETVHARQMSPHGHTRLPRYIRGHTGRIHAYYGWHILPDANAHGDKRGEPLYCVAFRASDLWPEDGRANDYVYIDMWESYLESA